jgi:hypothetical protein
MHLQAFELCGKVVLMMIQEKKFQIWLYPRCKSFWEKKKDPYGLPLELIVQIWPSVGACLP